MISDFGDYPTGTWVSVVDDDSDRIGPVTCEHCGCITAVYGRNIRRHRSGLSVQCNGCHKFMRWNNDRHADAEREEAMRMLRDGPGASRWGFTYRLKGPRQRPIR